MPHLRLAAGLALLIPLAPVGVAWARKNGIAAQGCDGCHSGGQVPTVTMTATPMNPAVGQAVTVTVSVSQTNGPVAGFFLTTSPPVGTFVATQAATAVSGDGVIHTSPHTGSGGFTVFQAQWSATKPTGANFQAFVLSANNDGTDRGDGANEGSLSITAGCAGANYYLDQDGDGYGTSDPAYPVIRDCAQPMGYASVAGDCDDFRAATHPGAPELCDGKDNNCNGQIDENVVTQTYCQDKDGDGHGVFPGPTMLGCTPPAGYGDCKGDCNDYDATVYPGAMELCDNKDNNCDGQIDEGARATCGMGWCRRYAIGCTNVCTPGAPLTETCNLFDDDCDGVVDNGTDLELCGEPGLKCVTGVCVPGSSSTGAGAGGGGVDAGAGTSGTGSTSGGSGGETGGSVQSPLASGGGCFLSQRGSAGGDSSAASLSVLLSMVAAAGFRRPRKRERGSARNRPALRPR